MKGLRAEGGEERERGKGERKGVEQWFPANVTVLTVSGETGVEVSG